MKKEVNMFGWLDNKICSIDSKTNGLLVAVDEAGKVLTINDGIHGKVTWQKAKTQYEMYLLTGTTRNDLVEEIYNELDPIMKDALYRKLWFDHVREDCEGRFKDGTHMLKSASYDKVMDRAARSYVYDCDYDCTLDYWTNIDDILNNTIWSDDWTFNYDDTNKSELAVETEEKFIVVCRNSNNEYEYSLFDLNYKLIDGGVLEGDVYVNIVDAMEAILKDLEIYIADVVNYNDVVEKADEVNKIE